uniref:Uncharacterized protein n=1 Tax=Vespula pensylvanica TaxID=30213 RepID=A0A834NAF4_VESPE|nr:hypothetical protein H0235_015970 [Vespula pensylvanica]
MAQELHLFLFINSQLMANEFTYGNELKVETASSATNMRWLTPALTLTIPLGYALIELHLYKFIHRYDYRRMSKTLFPYCTYSSRKNFRFHVQTIDDDYVPDTACPHTFDISASRKIIILVKSLTMKGKQKDYVYTPTIRHAENKKL